jgi:hypothetical protein
MAGKSDFLEAAILNHVFRSATLNKPSAVYVGLHTADPTDADAATELPIGVNGYTRAAVTGGDASWSAPADAGALKQIANAVSITFGTPTGDWASGNPITHFSINDAASGGNQLYNGALGAARTVLNGDNPPSFAPGSLVIQEG